ncbi:MAG: alpha/beta hydrolase [Cyanobacteriota bacterium]|nr:alpha/beta hydrolase [Cyanobacteriota bacterium]
MKIPQLLPSRPQRIFTFVSSLVVGAVTLVSNPSTAAERVEFNLSVLEFGVSVQDLEDFARTGKVSQELNFFVGHLGEREQKYVREFLAKRADFTALQVSQFFYSNLGENILSYVGKLVQPHHGLNGERAIRAALILAAADSEGLSVLNFLKKFSSDKVLLNREEVLAVVNKFGSSRKATERVIAGVERLSTIEAESESKVTPESLPYLAQVGQYTVNLQTETIKDAKRDRSFNVDIYLPQGLNQPSPVVVLSHGLGSNRKHFASLGNFLASHGFIVVSLEHPGSNSEQLQRLLKGYSKQVFEVNEFIDRPQDVSYVLDYLAQRFPNTANVNQTGVVGQSFGGYTVLALAGAEIDFDRLTKECTQEVNSVNISLLLQCEALNLPRQFYAFRDERIKFAAAINPVGSSIFGSKGMAQIKIPIAIAAASEDVLASAVIEQIEPFSWMNNPDRYLFVARGVRHVADVQDLINTFVPSVADFIPDTSIQPLKEFGNTLILALIQTHVANRKDYRPFLQSSFAVNFSQPPNEVSVIRSLTPKQFNDLRIEQ